MKIEDSGERLTHVYIVTVFCKNVDSLPFPVKNSRRSTFSPQNFNFFLNTPHCPLFLPLTHPLCFVKLFLLSLWFQYKPPILRPNHKPPNKEKNDSR